MRTYLPILGVKENVSRLREVPLLTSPVAAVVQFTVSLPTNTSKVDFRVLPLRNAIFTPDTVSVSSRQNCIHCGLPLADQRVFKLPSSTFAATLPSSVLATTGWQVVGTSVAKGPTISGVSMRAITGA